MFFGIRIAKIKVSFHSVLTEDILKKITVNLKSSNERKEMEKIWWGLIIGTSVLVLTTIIILFTVSLYPTERPLSKEFKETLLLDVIIVDEPGFDTNKAIENAKEMLHGYFNEVYSVKKQTDILSRHTLARLNRFMVFTKASMLITSHISLDDLFGRDSVTYIQNQDFDLIPIPPYDRKILQERGTRFRMAKQVPVSCVPIVVDQQILVELIDDSDFLKNPPTETVFYFYLNYAWVTSRAILSKKHSFYFLKSPVEKAALTQRKFIYLTSWKLQQPMCDVICSLNKSSS